jgi:hypothetical protein
MVECQLDGPEERRLTRPVVDAQDQVVARRVGNFGAPPSPPCLGPVFAANKRAAASGASSAGGWPARRKTSLQCLVTTQELFDVAAQRVPPL